MGAVQERGCVGRASSPITPRPEHFPFWSTGRLEAVKRVDVFARASGNVTVGQIGSAVRDALGTVGLGPLKGTSLTELPAAPLDAFPLAFSTNAVDDVWLAVTWGAAA